MGRGRVGGRGEARGQVEETRVTQRRSSPSPRRLAPARPTWRYGRGGEEGKEAVQPGVYEQDSVTRGDRARKGAGRSGGRSRRGKRASRSGAAAPRPAASPPRAPRAWQLRGGEAHEREEPCGGKLTWEAVMASQGLVGYDGTKVWAFATGRGSSGVQRAAVKIGSTKITSNLPRKSRESTWLLNSAT